MKDTLIEIKNNLQGNKVEWMKPRMKSSIWNIRKQKNNQSEQQEEKRLQKKGGWCKEPLGQLQVYQHSHNGGARKRRESKKLETY